MVAWIENTQFTSSASFVRLLHGLGESALMPNCVLAGVDVDVPLHGEVPESCRFKCSDGGSLAHRGGYWCRVRCSWWWFGVWVVDLLAGTVAGELWWWCFGDRWSKVRILLVGSRCHFWRRRLRSWWFVRRKVLKKRGCFGRRRRGVWFCSGCVDAVLQW